MSATQFICPNGDRVRIEECLKKCKQGQRCMFLPMLKAIANTSNRKMNKPTVTELIVGVRETYLKKMTDYAVDPFSVLNAIQGQAVHKLSENNAEGIMSEIRLEDGITSGKFDLYGDLLDEGDGVLGDIKVTNSYKIMKALGIYKVEVPTGEVYKTGEKKGQPKYRKDIRTDGVKEKFDWTLQLNYYRRMLEREGYEVKKMVIQAINKDSSGRIGAETGITEKSYLIEINRISDHWLKKYFSIKAKMLKEAIENKELPPICNARERWQDRKCLDYCSARENCPYAKRLKLEKEAKRDESTTAEKGKQDLKS